MTNNKLGRMSFFALILFIACNAAYAIPITFKASNFVDTFSGTSPPQQSVLATFDYSINAVNEFTLNSFSMTILNKVYGLADVAFLQPGNSNLLAIGGPSFGVYTLQYGTNDFALFFYGLNSSFNVLGYTTEGITGYWASTETTVISSVPEPTSITLLMLALAGVRLNRKRTV
jgi:hypothetical protein